MNCIATKLIVRFIKRFKYLLGSQIFRLLSIFCNVRWTIIPGWSDHELSPDLCRRNRRTGSPCPRAHEATWMEGCRKQEKRLEFNLTPLKTTKVTKCNESDNINFDHLMLTL